MFNFSSKHLLYGMGDKLYNYLKKTCKINSPHSWTNALNSTGLLHLIVWSYYFLHLVLIYGGWRCLLLLLPPHDWGHITAFHTNPIMAQLCRRRQRGALLGLLWCGAVTDVFTSHIILGACFRAFCSSFEPQQKSVGCRHAMYVNWLLNYHHSFKGVCTVLNVHSSYLAIVFNLLSMIRFNVSVYNK